MEIEEKKTINRVMENKAFLGSDVEIIIPFNGKQALVSNIIQDIFNTVYSNRYLITLIDDGSKNNNFFNQMQKAKIPGLRCFRQESQKGFGAAVNFALQNPWKFENPELKIPYVLIVQSDVSLTSKNWLLNLGYCLEKLKSIGVKMVTPMTNNPVEQINCLKSERPCNIEDKILENDEFIPMYCALCHRDLFNHVGPILEVSYPSIESKDFALRMKAKGFRQAVCGNSWVHHKGRATISLFDKNVKAQKILRKIKETL